MTSLMEGQLETERAIAPNIPLANDQMWTIGQIEETIAQHRHFIEDFQRLVATPTFESGDSALLHKNLATHRLHLAQALLCRYLRAGGLPNLDELSSLCDLILLSKSSNENIRSLSSGILGIAHRLRFQQEGHLANVDKSIKCLSSALELGQPETEEYQYFEAQLGRSYCERSDYNLSKEDVVEALRLHTHAVENAAEGHLYSDMCLYSLGRTRLRLYFLTFDLSDLHTAMAHLRAALHLQPIGHRDRHLALLALFTAHCAKYEHSSIRNDLEQCLALARECVEICPNGHPDRVEVLLKYSKSKDLLFKTEGIAAELDDAIRCARETVEICPEHHPRRYVALGGLAGNLHRRCCLHVNRADMDESIQLHRQSIDLQGDQHAERAYSLIPLSISIRDRYQRLGHESDILQMMELCDESFSLLPESNRFHSYALFNLVEGLALSFEYSGSMQDLVRACQLSTKWFHTSENKDDPSYGNYASSGGLAMLQLYVYTGDTSKLMEAIELLEVAENKLAFIDAYMRTETLNSLATALRLRYQETGDTEDFERALAIQYHALEGVDVENSDRSRTLCGAAHLHLLPGTQHYNLAKSVALLKEVVGNSAIRHARLVLPGFLDVLDKLESLPEGERTDVDLQASLFELYEHASALLPHVAYLGLDGRSRLRVLQQADSLGTNAATQATLVSKLERAIELLEETHAIFWTQHLRLRSSYDSLPGGIGEELGMVARQIELIQKEDSDGSQDDYIARVHELCQRFDDLLQQIHGQPGLERFMMHDSYGTLSQAASKGPIVILLHNRSVTFALVIKAIGIAPEKVALPQVTNSLLQQLIHNWTSLESSSRNISDARGMRVTTRVTDRSTSTLSALWSQIMQPIIRALGMPAALGRQRPRLWICATGLFSRLPLHAAGAYLKDSQSGTSVTGHCVVSYIPTIGALLRARDQSRPIKLATAKILLASAPSPVNWRPLPHAHLEVSMIRSAVPLSSVMNCATGGSPALSSADDVLHHVSEATILHLACHGFQRAGRPLESGFVMQDEVLTISRLMSLNLPNAFLAFLSACESARSDEKQPNQSITLASSMLFAGFKSVVGTMWSMGDVDGPVVAAKIYEALFHTGSETLELDVVPYALDEIAQEMRRQSLHMTRWATYTHLGI